MTPVYDALIVGSGPAGVSAAFPLVEAGLNVLMIDGGREPTVAPPQGQYLALRACDTKQRAWMIGEDFQALRHAGAVSPKLRVPRFGAVFEGFEAANRIESQGFMAAGSLASGGLANAWGCGVAKLSPHELRDYPFDATALDASYASVSRRMGLSGAAQDDLASYFGVDDWADEPVAMDTLQSRMATHYARKRSAFVAAGVTIGRSRVAVLTKDRGTRRACDLSGTCLWGCHRGALYTPAPDLQALMRHPNFQLRQGWVAQRLVAGAGVPSIEVRHAQGSERLAARRVLVGAGVLATTRLALEAISLRAPRPMHSCPTAAFLAWFPASLGRAHEPAFGLGQLSYTVALGAGTTGFGSFFSTTGIPVTEFSRHVPLARRFGIDVLSSLLSSCVIGNLFLPGCFAQARVVLHPDGSLRVSGTPGEQVPALMEEAKRRLGRAVRQMRGVVLPGSFTIGPPGSDIHYGSTLPMRAAPQPGETGVFGELAGTRGVHVVDAACLPSITEKSHTLTLMANADRIGTQVANELRASRQEPAGAGR